MLPSDGESQYKPAARARSPGMYVAARLTDDATAAILVESGEPKPAQRRLGLKLRLVLGVQSVSG